MEDLQAQLSEVQKQLSEEMVAWKIVEKRHKETEKLVKREYEVLDLDDDDVPRGKQRVAPEDDEYEFIDA